MRSLALILCVAAAACVARTAPQPTQTLQLSLLGQPGAGRYLNIELANTSDTLIAYHSCAQSLERQISGEWKTLHTLPYEVLAPGPERVCTTELPALGPRQSTIVQTRLPPQLDSGVYRIYFRDVPLDRHTGRPFGGTHTPTFRIP